LTSELSPPCSKCGCPDTPKYTRMKLRKTGKRSLSVASFCTWCHGLDQKEREARRYDKKLAYNKEWRKNNKEKWNAYNRKWYMKRKIKTWGYSDIGVTGSTNPSQMAYTPMWVDGKRN
jgi:hypothetical protein